MELINFILHFDEYLHLIINEFGLFTYLILFLIVFAETGLVVTPFLPGDSLLFAAGALGGGGYLDVRIVMPTLMAAALIGDNTNYWIGRRIGPKVFAKQNARLFKPAYLQKTQAFYEKYGVKTIIMARFVPIVRTFAPFVAGIGQMRYRTFLTYSVVGAFIWVCGLTLLGYFFGRMSFIKDNFEYAILAVIALSLVPAVIELAKHKLDGRKAAKATSYQDVQHTFEKENLSD